MSLRPGAFLDQIAQMGDPFAKRRLMWFGDTGVPLTYVLMTDLAGYLADAVDTPAVEGQRIDIGWDRPVSMQDTAAIASELVGEPVRVRAIPGPVIHVLAATVGRLVPMIQDLGAMFAWFETGKYVADTTQQAQAFGPPPTAEEAITRFARSLGHEAP